MIYAFVGTVEDCYGSTLRGTGKTNSMVGYLYLEYLAGRKIYTNFYTSFSEKIDSCQNIIEHLEKYRPDNVSCGFTEMHNVINSIGQKARQVLFITKFASQIRKLDCDALYDTQRFHDIHLRLQLHTDIIFIPEKRHLDNVVCNNDRCIKDHEIYVYRYKPFYPKWVRKFYPELVGKLYDSKQIVFDTLDKDIKV